MALNDTALSQERPSVASNCVSRRSLNKDGTHSHVYTSIAKQLSDHGTTWSIDDDCILDHGHLRFTYFMHSGEKHQYWFSPGGELRVRFAIEYTAPRLPPDVVLPKYRMALSVALNDISIAREGLFTELAVLDLLLDVVVSKNRTAPPVPLNDKAFWREGIFVSLAAADLLPAVVFPKHDVAPPVPLNVALLAREDLLTATPVFS